MHRDLKEDNDRMKTQKDSQYKECIEVYEKRLHELNETYKDSLRKLKKENETRQEEIQETL
jgi:uncharacterized protein YecT (DUF1311 family)